MADEWIMYCTERDDPECIHTVEEAVEYINRIGFLPLFKNEIPGFSFDERTVREFWWCNDAVRDPLLWRAVIARQHDIIYGKFFNKKAGFISKNGFRCLLITGVTDMILMHCTKMVWRRTNTRKL